MPSPESPSDRSAPGRARALGWSASYGDPIAVERGERVTPTGRRDEWEGHPWLWCRARDGREGWVPASILRMEGETAAVATRRYDALELDCGAGDALAVMESLGGWAWCRAADGREGWVPWSALERV